MADEERDGGEMLASSAWSVASALDSAANLFDDAAGFFDRADDVTFARMMTDGGAGFAEGLDAMRQAHARLAVSIVRVDRYINQRAGRMTGNGAGQN